MYLYIHLYTCVCVCVCEQPEIEPIASLSSVPHLSHPWLKKKKNNQQQFSIKKSIQKGHHNCRLHPRHANMDGFLLPLPSFKPHSCLQLLSLLFQFSFWIIKKFLLTFKGQYFFSTVGPRDVTFTSILLWSVRSHCPSWLLEFKPVPLLLVFSGSFPAVSCMFSSWPCVFTLCMACSRLPRRRNSLLHALSLCLLSVSFFLGDGSCSQGVWCLVPHDTRTPLSLGCTHRRVLPNST